MAVPQGPFAYIVGVQWGGDNFFVTSRRLGFVVTSPTGRTTEWTQRGAWGFLGHSAVNWGVIWKGTFHRKRREFYLIGDYVAAGPETGPQLIKSSDGVTWEQVMSREQMSEAFGDGDEGATTTNTWIGYSTAEKRLYALSMMNKPPPENYYASLNVSSDGQSWSKLKDGYGPDELIVPPSIPKRGSIVDPDDPNGEKTISIQVRDPRPWFQPSSTANANSLEYQKYIQRERTGLLQVSFNNGVSWVDSNVGMTVDGSGLGFGVTDFACGAKVIVAGGADGLKTSADGLTWTTTFPRYADPSSFGDVWMIGFASKVFFALARDPADDFIWGHISEDGYSWTRLPDNLDYFGETIAPLFVATGRVRQE